MSTATITVRYDGPILANHQMDVADIAPALLGLSELCKIANRKFNGDRARVQVLIGTDAEHKCFQVNLHILQTAWEFTKTVLSSEDVKTARELIEWLGIGGSASVLGFIGLLKQMKTRRICETEFSVHDGRNVVMITIEGDNNNIVVAHPEALELLRDEAAIQNAKKVVQPVAKDGYDHMEFESNGKVVESIDKNEANEIAAIIPSDLEHSETDEPQVITAWVTVYSPVYDLKAPLWRFKFGEVHDYMDISGTDIAENAIKRGGALIDDAYRVELEITQEHKPSGIVNHYKIRRVIDFRPARLPYQHDAFK